MKRHSALKLTCLALLLWTTAAYSSGSGAVQLLDNGSISLQDFHGRKPILLKFWATWCGECLAQMPDYRDLYTKYGDDVQFVAVNVAVSDPIEKVLAAVLEHDLRMPVAYDKAGQLWDEFGIVGTPTYVLIDINGSVIYSGFRHDEKLDAALQAATVVAKPSQTAAGAARSDSENPGDKINWQDIDGNALRIGSESSEAILVYHFAPWCESYLQQTYPEQVERCRRFRQSLQAINDVPIIGIASRYSSTQESVRNYRDRYDIQHPLVFDESGTFGQLAGTRDFPFAVVLKAGVVVASSAEIDSTIRTALRK